MRTAQFTRVSCDVLCIGGSGAAASAAFMAAQKGMSVALVSKGKAGRSGNAMMVGGGFGVDGYSARHILGEAQADERYTPQALFEKVVKASFFLSDQALAEQFVTEAPLMTKQFLEWSRAAGQNFPFVKSGLYAVSGSSVGKTIQQGIKSAVGCKVYDDVMVLELLTDCGRVAGALGLDIYTGDYIVFEAKCVVLATGGFQPHTLKNTISEMSGDGMAMALRAGARLADMEFLLYIPTAVQPPYLRGSILPYLFTIPVFMAYLGDADAYRAEQEAAKGSQKHREALEAMCYQTSKEIAACAAVLCGEVDAIIITGGMAHSLMMMDWIRRRVEFIAPVALYPGEYEMQSLALSAYDALRGMERIKELV